MLLSISDSWQTMEFLEKLYWCFAVPFSLLFLIQIIITFFAGDMDSVEAEGDADAAIDDDTGIDFQFLTLKNLVAFFTIFGWTGIACVSGGMNTLPTIFISIASGLVMMTIMASIAYFMGKLVDDGTLNLKNAKGKLGSVYLRIPAKRRGTGKVQVKVQGLQTLDAITDNEEDIMTGALVEITDVINDNILLVKISGN
jgi:hypothetical protein